MSEGWYDTVAPSEHMDSARSSVYALASSEVRRWARENGIEVKSKGSIPAEVIEQFEAQRQLRLA